MLISISEALETPVSVLLGETVTDNEPDELKAISKKLEVINLQLAQQKRARRKTLHWFFILLCAVIAVIFIIVIIAGSPYLNWDFSDPETAVAGTILHGFEFLFVRIAPFVFIGGVVGAVLTRNRS